jgi:hypothetical protein
MASADAQMHVAHTIDKIVIANRQKTDAFVEALIGKRPDLAGLPFLLGDACRMKPGEGQKFVAQEGFRKVLAHRSADLAELHRRLEDNKGDGNKPYEVPDLSYYYDYYKQHGLLNEMDPAAQVASTMQVCGPEPADTQLGVISFLSDLAHVDATRALARLAIFSEEPEVRTAALRSLKLRRDRDYTDILLAGLKYPWPAVAERTSKAIVQLGRSDLVPHLIDVLEGPDPRAPQTREISGKKVSVVRELVRVNHNHNCLLCHAPATAERDGASKQEAEKLAPLTAQIPIPSDATNAYYRPSNAEILVRFDVTYLRQDFSRMLPVNDTDPWPGMQRYDFLVRTRTVSDQEAGALRELLLPQGADSVSAYHRAAAWALKELTGRDAETAAMAGQRKLEIASR